MAGPASAVAPSASAANLKLRGLGPGSGSGAGSTGALHSHSNSGCSYVSGQVANGRAGPGAGGHGHSTLVRSVSDAADSGSLTVTAPPEPRWRPLQFLVFPNPACLRLT